MMSNTKRESFTGSVLEEGAFRANKKEENLVKLDKTAREPFISASRHEHWQFEKD